jgi:hypothetical protein
LEENSKDDSSNFIIHTGQQEEGKNAEIKEKIKKRNGSTSIVSSSTSYYTD